MQSTELTKKTALQGFRRDEHLLLTRVHELLKALQHKLPAHVYTSITQSVPLNIFSQGLSPLESLATHLQEQGKSVQDIAHILGRNPSTIRTTHTNAKAKKRHKGTDSTVTLPLWIFADRRLSVLEHIVRYLREELGHTNKQIAVLLKRDSKTIWTVYHRAKEKQR